MNHPAEQPSSAPSPRTLPDGWRWVKLGDHALKIGSGLTPLGGQATYILAGIPLIRSQNVHMNRFTYEGLAFITAEQDEAMPESRVQSGDVLLNITGASIGRVCVVPDKVTPANVNQHVSIIRSNGSFDPWFLSFFLSTPASQKHIRDTQAGATRQALTKGLIEFFKIPLPPLPEQQRIAAILREQMAAVEKARAAAQARLEAVKALPAAFFRQVFPQPGQHLPDGWQWARLGEIAKTTSGSTPARSQSSYYNGDIPWVKTGELRDGYIEQAEESITAQAVSECSLSLLPPGTLLIAMYGQGQTRGRTGILGIRAATNQACFAVLPNEKAFLAPYLQAWFRYSYDRIRSDTEGRGGNQPNLNGQILREMVIPLPSPVEQQRITAILAGQLLAVDTTRAAAQAELAAINALPAALLRQAFNGEI
jgi:type I restriction enzyme, S subunit